MEKSRKNKLLIISILVIGIALVGSTFAWLSWRSGTNTTVNFTVTSNFSCSADGVGNITSRDVSIVPASCTDSEHAIVREITASVVNNGDTPVYMDLWLEIENIGGGLTESKNFKYALTTSPTSCTTGVEKSGSFNGKVQDDKVQILKGSKFVTSDSKKYYLYIWLDSAETSLSTTNQSFELSLGGSCTNGASSEPSAPVLDDTGMIPVTIANDGTVTTVSENDPNWYNYEEKQWANAVLVKQTGTKTRTYYLTTPNETVNQSDILAYYVWIPKYSYKMNGTEEKISISFDYNKSGYISHPAFNFGGEEIDGFWVGKFETTQGTSSNIGTGTPTILPNTTSWRSQKVSTQFTNSIKFSGGNYNTTTGVVTYEGSGTYGLGSNTISHMMKNSEWGAVAYLSHSDYGIGKEIYINNSEGYFTGRSGGNVGGSVKALATQYNDSSLSTSTQYNSNGYYTWLGQEISSSGTVGNFASDRTLGTNASTTGNVSGVYDMSGGAYEYVMGVFANSAGDLWTGDSSSFNSGFTGLYGSGSSTGGSEGQFSGTAFPEAKFYDKYMATSGTTISATTACNGGICYGHALSETSGWYSDTAYFVSSYGPWFRRGGSYKGDAAAGAFLSSDDTGNSFRDGSWRSVLAVR